ncbi:MAG: glycosyl hydrolase, partial [Bacteroidota bacterium]
MKKTAFLCLCLMLSSVLTAQLAEQVLPKVPFRSLGPGFMSGRISDIAKDPQNSSTWYVAAASGNLWKTTNNGTTWKPIFEQYGSFSLGCVTIDPQNSTVIWLGTGENQSQRSVSWGDGIYKSLDAGKSWTNIGLKQSEHISKILVHPQNSDIVYVAAQGPLWSAGGQRGVFKTTDGGKTWNQVLEISAHTGVSDLIFDPKNPDVIYAASYQRRRHVGILVAGGPDSRIYKSTDAGANWKILKRGLPGGDLGRIAIAVSPQQNNVVYALIAGSEKSQSGFYRSEDFGESWVKKNDYIVVDPQYYGELFVDPHRFDHVYAVDVMIHYTINGGQSFQRLNSRFKHVDNHAILFDENDPDYIMVGCDGGVYESWDRGQQWKYHSNLPITQFYRVGLDNEFPIYNVFGGTQDNSTIYGPSKTLDRHGVKNSDWKLALGGDGFQARIDPENSNIVYCQFQYAGLNRYDKKTGQRLEIQPQPGPEDEALRWHWDAPLLISPHDSKRLYYAAQKVFRSDDRGDSWKLVSGDLSRGENRNERVVMGKVWPPEAVWKNVYTSPFGTIVSLAESPIQEGLLIAGTDDGLIQISDDGGDSWRRSYWGNIAPEKTYVADEFASQHDVQTFYAVLNNHKEGDFKPYVIKTSNAGKSWSLITKGLAAPHVCWSIIEDHETPDLLFLATEYGLFTSVNAGASWIQLKGKLPTIAFRDLEIQKRENDLVAASFGRGMFILDDYAWIRSLAEADQNQAQIFPIKDA